MRIALTILDNIGDVSHLLELFVACGLELFHYFADLQIKVVKLRQVILVREYQIVIGGMQHDIARVNDLFVFVLQDWEIHVEPKVVALGLVNFYDWPVDDERPVISLSLNGLRVLLVRIKSCLSVIVGKT